MRDNGVRALRDDVTDASELRMDALLGIRTTGRDESHADQDNNPYEPTPYAVLERLANSGLVGKRNVLVDYGCGKGRVGLYLAYQARCRSIGVERDPQLHEGALRNAGTARFLQGPYAAGRVTFELADAARYEPPTQADRFYFFNPFSAAVFERVLGQIHRSLDAVPREILLFVYYPDDEYRDVLARTPWLEPAGQIDCRDLFCAGIDDPGSGPLDVAPRVPCGDPREVVLAFRG